jgi:hypothetical protein
VQLLEVVLYNDDGDRRSIMLRPGQLNIITGESHAGKSALVEIIRYCLGEGFSVPHGPIRESVRWYGLRLTIGNTEVFIGRPPPEPGRASASAVSFHAGAHVPAPAYDELEPTTNTSALERLLTGLVGIAENEQLPPPGARRPVPTLQANFSHARIFCFQLQDEIANRRLLFHRQQEPFVAQAIGDVLPYFLGAVETDTLALRNERRETKRALDAARAQLDRSLHIRETARDKALALAAEAVSVGLVPETDALAAAPLAELDALLRQASVRPIDAAAPPGSALQKLEERRSAQADEYRALQDQLQLVRALLREHGNFGEVATNQVARLESAALLPEAASEVCPLCAQPLPEHIPVVAEIVTTFERLSAQLDQVERDRPRLRATLDELEQRGRELRRGLQELTRALDELAATEEQTAALRTRGQEQAFVRGKVQQYLATLGQADEEQILALEAQVRVLEERLAQIDEALSSETARANAVSILNVIGRDMSAWAQQLELEQPSVRIDLSQLTVVADTEGGAVPLALMGSAANWIGYHLTAHLGLHKHFVERNRPVPRFLVLDQPTQAYFPPDAPAGVDLPEADSDREAVRRMFELLRDVVATLAPEFQILVLDHLKLDTPWFEESIVEEWRGGLKLIPSRWHPEA